PDDPRFRKFGLKRSVFCFDIACIHDHNLIRKHILPQDRRQCPAKRCGAVARRDNHRNPHDGISSLYSFISRSAVTATLFFRDHSAALFCMARNLCSSEHSSITARASAWGCASSTATQHVGARSLTSPTLVPTTTTPDAMASAIAIPWLS